MNSYAARVLRPTNNIGNAYRLPLLALLVCAAPTCSRNLTDPLICVNQLLQLCMFDLLSIPMSVVAYALLVGVSYGKVSRRCGRPWPALIIDETQLAGLSERCPSALGLHESNAYSKNGTYHHRAIFRSCLPWAYGWEYDWALDYSPETRSQQDRPRALIVNRLFVSFRWAYS